MIGIVALGVLGASLLAGSAVLYARDWCRETRRREFERWADRTIADLGAPAPRLFAAGTIAQKVFES